MEDGDAGETWPKAKKHVSPGQSESVAPGPPTSTGGLPRPEPSRGMIRPRSTAGGIDVLCSAAVWIRQNPGRRRCVASSLPRADMYPPTSGRAT